MTQQNNGLVAYEVYKAARRAFVIGQQIDSKITMQTSDLLNAVADQMNDDNVCEMVTKGDPPNDIELIADFGMASADNRSDVWLEALRLARLLNSNTA